MKIGCLILLVIVFAMFGEGESLILNKRLQPRKIKELEKSKTHSALIENRPERKSDLISWIKQRSDDYSSY